MNDMTRTLTFPVRRLSATCVTTLPIENSNKRAQQTFSDTLVVSVLQYSIQFEKLTYLTAKCSFVSFGIFRYEQTIVQLVLPDRIAHFVRCQLARILLLLLVLPAFDVGKHLLVKPHETIQLVLAERSRRVPGRVVQRSELFALGIGHILLANVALVDQPSQQRYRRQTVTRPAELWQRAELGQNGGERVDRLAPEPFRPFLFIATDQQRVQILVRAGEQDAALDAGLEAPRSARSRSRVGVLRQQQVVAHHTTLGHDEHHGQNLARQRDQVRQGDTGYLSQAISGCGVASRADVAVFHARKCTTNNNHPSKLFINSIVLGLVIVLLLTKIKLIFKNEQQYTYSPLNMSVISGETCVKTFCYLYAADQERLPSSECTELSFPFGQIPSVSLVPVSVYLCSKRRTRYKHLYKQKRFSIG
ncbi:hypothetical protein T4C_1753 [Trichinella pseudospiralis]|uniref:Uncharacterized protein n=1 Tax=Trichinella pseudospiralis TaxID=6337 RepID=A0A0V1JYH4_TRIPS|nr:hypothetical protein T4C_1753 [Trichinella pseudospiralis]